MSNFIIVLRMLMAGIVAVLGLALAAAAWFMEGWQSAAMTIAVAGVAVKFISPDAEEIKALSDLKNSIEK